MRIQCSSAWLVVRGVVMAALVLLLSVPLQAQPTPASDGGDGTPAPEDEASKLEQAKLFFRQGNEMRKVRDYERALELYVKSRTLMPSGPNTMNAAFCLDKLSRPDEALEMYEELLTKFPDALTEADRKVVIPTVARLRSEVGSIEVDANVDGTLTIDGRRRGTLPRTTPLRVLPGKRKVTVMKDGYRAFVQVVEVEAGKTTKVDAKLEPLAASGRVRIEARAVRCDGAPPAACAGADVWIDGARVGQVPWEGELAPGDHWLVVHKGQMGSAPQNVVVVKGQIVLPAVVAAPVGPQIEIVVVPATAALRIGDVAVGNGRWKGVLPLGVHELHVHEAGYLDHTQEMSIGRTSQGKVQIELEIDEDHERWGVEADLSAAGVLTFVGYGVGVAGAVIGSIVGALTLSDQTELEGKCLNTACSQSEIDKLTTQAHVSTGSFVAAGAGVVLGTVAMILWLTEENPSAEAAGLTLRPYALGGLALEGRF